MSKEKRDGNVVARTACEQMVNRLKTQGCEAENCSGTWCIQTPAGAELHLSACYISGYAPWVQCAYWNRDSEGYPDANIEVPYDADLDQFCGWAMAL